MSKNYILEPIALEFTSADQYKVQAELAGTDLATKTISELKALIPAGTTIEFNGEKYITVGSSSSAESIKATKTGEAPSPGVTVPIIVFYGYVTIAEEPVPAHITYDSGEDSANPGTYTVSIYTETEEKPDYPVKNFTYEFANPAKNDIEDLIQAIYINLGETESQESYGHSPADRLVIAVAKLHNVDPEAALTTGNYPNQIKRIAAIIRNSAIHNHHI